MTVRLYKYENINSGEQLIFTALTNAIDYSSELIDSLIWHRDVGAEYGSTNGCFCEVSQETMLWILNDNPNIREQLNTANKELGEVDYDEFKKIVEQNMSFWIKIED